MVNDFLKELYLNIVVPHMVWSPVEAITIDKYPLSEVIAKALQIGQIRLVVSCWGNELGPRADAGKCPRQGTARRQRRDAVVARIA